MNTEMLLRQYPCCELTPAMARAFAYSVISGMPDSLIARKMRRSVNAVKQLRQAARRAEPRLNGLWPAKVGKRALR